jgi:hypothetical protein
MFSANQFTIPISLSLSNKILPVFINCFLLVSVRFSCSLSYWDSFQLSCFQILDFLDGVIHFPGKFPLSFCYTLHSNFRLSHEASKFVSGLSSTHFGQ